MGEPTSNSQVHLIIGASGGIGAALSQRLHKAGHKVLLASRGSDRLDALASELQTTKWQIDAVDIGAVETCVSEASREFGRIDGIVNCVGSLLLKPAHLTNEQEWHDTLATNLTSAFATVRAAGKIMANRGGSVVLMSSAAARIGLPSHEAIAAAKAGIIGLAQSAAASYASRNLRFNVVAPGLIQTKMTRKIWESERAAANSTAMHALGRLGEPQEVASLIAWLIDPANAWVTGEVFGVDGGLGNVRSNPKAVSRK